LRLALGGAPTIRYAELGRELERRASGRPSLADVRSAVIAIRRSKSMVLDAADANGRSCGSFFVNPIVSVEQARAVAERAGDPSMPQHLQHDGRVKLSAAWLIERAGLSRGNRRGPVGLSSRHTLAIVCHTGARADDVVSYARHVRRSVEDRFGVRLVPEPVFWGFSSLEDGLPDDRIA
jgi:UDP-N-acetylmuramate dehydrogenase